MIICPACNQENVDGTQFCEFCGEELPQATAAASTENLVPCPECGFENPADNLACEACGADLQPGIAATTPAPAPSLSKTDDPFAALPDTGLAPPIAPAAVPAVIETTPFDASIAPPPGANLTPGSVKLVVEQGQSVGAQFVLGDAELLVGREDEDEEIYPDIDLSDQDAGYVHRRHATLNFENGNLTVTHLGGSNKTRINNKPIADNVPSPVKLGDKIAFGKVVLRLLPV
jgi:hypothetical protein